jgi:hypothetical protein
VPKSPDAGLAFTANLAGGRNKEARLMISHQAGFDPLTDGVRPMIPIK